MLAVFGPEPSLTVTAVTWGGWLSKMVPTAVPRLIVAPTGFDRVTVNVSVGSGMVSSMVGTRMVREVWPGANVSVPDSGVKSAPDVAVPEAVV